MRPIETVRQALDARTWTDPRGKDHDFMARCPAHEDGRPSLHVTEGDDGRALLHCFAGCPPQEIVAAAGLDWDDTFPPKDEKPAAPAPSVQEARYTYTDAEGNPLFAVVRFTGKRFRQQKYNAGRWEWNMDGVERVLYRLPEVLKAKAEGRWVFVTEGEKDADAVLAAGQCGTTMPGGAGKWQESYTETLTGAKVVILADDDEPGHRHARAVYQQLYGKAAKVGVRLPAEGSKDVADHIASGLSLNGDLRKAPELQGGPPVPVSGRTALTAAVFASRPGSGKTLEVLGPLFQRGMRTVIGAQTGEGKTTIALQAIAAVVADEPVAFLGDEKWTRRSNGGRALVIDVEQGEETLKRRLIESGLHESERVDVLWEPNGIALDRREEDRAMVHEILREGDYDMILLDPLYQLHLGSGNDEEVAAQTMRVVDGWAREFNCSVVIPMHARKPAADAPRRFTKHDIAGVGTWLRNAEFILGLQMRSTGFSQLYFFKDRMGFGPEINSWWGLSFERSEGFRRNFAEDKKRVTAEVEELLKRDDGATREEIAAVRGLDELGLERILRRKTVHERAGRYRSKPWEEQTALDAETLGLDS